MNWSQDLYVRAFRFATAAHVGQKYPGTDLPYIMHVAFVGMETIAALEHDTGANGDLAVQCALLHDTIEDTDSTHGEIETEFGKNVADGVLALTKDRGLKKEERMADSLRRIKEQPREIWMVKMADRISNLQPPPFYWNAEKTNNYRTEAIEIHNALKDASVFLAKRLNVKIENYGV